MAEKKPQYTVMVICMPAYGHLNPVCSLVNELAKTKNVRVIFFGNAEHKELIERARAEFRLCKIEIVDPNKSINDMRHDFPLADMMSRYMNIADEMMPKYLRTVEQEGVDLVLHDFGAVWARWFVEYMNNMHAAGRMTRKPPKTLMVSASVLFDPRVYPSETEAKFFPKPKFAIRVFIIMMLFQLKYWWFYRRHGFKYVSAMEFLVFSKDKLNLVAIAPQLHPRSHLFDKSIKFIGNFASEDLRGAKTLQDPLKTFLEPFEPRNPLPLTNLALEDRTFQELNQQPKLVYASFGTLANQDMKAYMSMIEAVKQFDQESNKSGVKGSQIRLLLSVGHKSFAQFQSMIQSGQLKVPANVLILDQVPQLDVLKRASLFITHSGQGSTNEAVHYGVPMVCIPVIGDQPLVAYRAADELGLGIRLSVDEVDFGKIRRAMIEIFEDKAYLERSLVFAQLSAKHNGLKQGTDIIMGLLEDKDKSKTD